MSAHTVPVTDAHFKSQVLDSDLPVLVDFWAPWCPPCRRVAPVLDDLAQEYAGRVVIGKVNTDEDARHAQQLGIRGIPTMILFRGGREVDRVVGALPKAELKRWIDHRLVS
ncbi:MAG: thioredoxin [Acidobacteria bacterium]|nr:thioredoxin [Acidobacteriota bacterium]